MIRPGALLVAGALALAACGGGDEAGHLDAQVDAVRAAVQAGDRHAALAGIDDIAAVALAAHAEGHLDDAEVQEAAALVDQARALVDQHLPEPTTTTTEAPAPPPTPAPAPVVVDDDDDDDDDGGGGGRGEGNRKKKDRDDD